MSPFKNALLKSVHIAPLVTFRIVFGIAMLVSAVRFLLLGWVENQYIQSKFQFTYYGFEWVKILPAWGMYGLYFCMLISSIGIILGYRYRIAAILFFISFTYTELIDKTYYLNHYYFVSVIALLLIFLPAHRYFSLDVKRNPLLETTHIPQYLLFIIKLQLGIVYFYAGIAKINYDWLMLAQPLSIWLPAHNDLPLIGPLFRYQITAYIFSWFGMIYDIFIPFALLFPKTRWFAYSAVIVFHVFTGILFQIGVFPVVMITATLIFFSEKFHLKLLGLFQHLFHTHKEEAPVKEYVSAYPRLNSIFLVTFLSFQVLFPFRYLLYPGNLFWTEEGYRFSWRVMLVEKAGTATFYIKDQVTGFEATIDNSNFLTTHQEKQMSMQPDMILQFAHFLHDTMEKSGLKDPIVRAEVWVTMNGRKSELLIDPQVNLARQKENFYHKSWILDCHD